MPRRLRAAKSRRDRLKDSEIVQLICGADFFDDAYGGRDEGIDDERMLQDWRDHRAEIEEHAARDPLRQNWPIYIELRARGLSHDEALAARRQAHAPVRRG